jgi:hypothetical protein
VADATGSLHSSHEVVGGVGFPAQWLQTRSGALCRSLRNA